MEKEQRYQVVVHSKVQDGYRRAGFALQKGTNLLMDVTAAQIEQFKADPRLVFGSQDPMPTEPVDDLSKGLSQDDSDDKTQRRVDGGLVPTDLTVEQLKTKLNELNIAFTKDAKKPDLVALLETAMSSTTSKEGE